MDRDELIENLRTTLLWETVCAHIEHRSEADSAGRLYCSRSDDNYGLGGEKNMDFHYELLEETRAGTVDKRKGRDFGFSAGEFIGNR